MPAKREQTAPPPADSLAALRAQIDAVDARLLEAIAERMQIAERVGAAKTAEGATAAAPVHRPGREASLIRKLIAGHDRPDDAAAIHAVWRELIGASIAVQQPLTVATADSAAEQAARLHFGASQRYAWAAGPVLDVANGLADIGLFPAGDGAAWQAAAELLAARADCALLWRLPFTLPGGRWIAVGRGLEEASGADLAIVLADPAAVPDDPAVETLCRLADGRAVLAIDGEIAGDPPPDIRAAGPAADVPVLYLGRLPAPLEIGATPPDSRSAR